MVAAFYLQDSSHECDRLGTIFFATQRPRGGKFVTCMMSKFEAAVVKTRVGKTNLVTFGVTEIPNIIRQLARHQRQ